MTSTDVFIGLGSNQADPSAQLAGAVARLAALSETELVAQSPFYRSKPVGPQDQPDFVNGAAWLRTELSALELLDQLQAIEQAHGRERIQHWGPRTLDLDLHYPQRPQLLAIMPHLYRYRSTATAKPDRLHLHI